MQCPTEFSIDGVLDLDVEDVYAVIDKDPQFSGRQLRRVAD